MKETELRQRLRAVLAGSKCVSPADIYDPVSARVAESVGYEIGALTGAMASISTLATPDLMVLTLSELASQIRRIRRVSDLALLIDADHGYGNALNVMRTVEELEHAGVAGLTIEDTRLPRSFGQPEDSLVLISIEEMLGKLRAAVSARRDPSLLIAGRGSLRIRNLDESIKRFKAYATTGIDAIFVVGLENIEQLKAIQAAVHLPIMLGPAPAAIKREALALHGARIVLHSHEPSAAVAKALHGVYSHLYKGGSPADLNSRIASAQEMDSVVNVADFAKRQRDFLK